MADVFLTANNAVSALAVALAADGLVVQVLPGAGTLFPDPGAGEYFIGTLASDDGLTREIVKVTAVSGDQMTVVRAQEGTAALVWDAGSSFQNLVTKGQLEALLQLAQLTATVVLQALGVAAGPLGTFLMSNGPGVDPSWEYPLMNTLPPPGMVDLGYSLIDGLTVPKGLYPPTGAVLAVLSPQDGNVRWLANGSLPDGETGNPLWGTSQLFFRGDLDSFQMINMTDSVAAVNVQFYGVEP